MLRSCQGSCRLPLLPNGLWTSFYSRYPFIGCNFHVDSDEEMVEGEDDGETTAAAPAPVVRAHTKWRHIPKVSMKDSDSACYGDLYTRTVTKICNKLLLTYCYR